MPNIDCLQKSACLQARGTYPQLLGQAAGKHGVSPSHITETTVGQGKGQANQSRRQRVSLIISPVCVCVFAHACACVHSCMCVWGMDFADQYFFLLPCSTKDDEVAKEMFFISTVCCFQLFHLF